MPEEYLTETAVLRSCISTITINNREMIPLEDDSVLAPL
jgi:hypothetical protein